MRHIPMNTNRPSDRIEQNFRFLFPIEFLELKDVVVERSHSIQKDRREKENKKNGTF